MNRINNNQQEYSQQQNFHYVHLKLSMLDDQSDHPWILHQPTRKTILQIIDVSDKLLYDEIKAEYEFHSMINATVSHELRNPLNSMICQL